MMNVSKNDATVLRVLTLHITKLLVFLCSSSMAGILETFAVRGVSINAMAATLAISNYALALKPSCLQVCFHNTRIIS